MYQNQSNAIRNLTAGGIGANKNESIGPTVNVPRVISMSSSVTSLVDRRLLNCLPAAIGYNTLWRNVIVQSTTGPMSVICVLVDIEARSQLSAFSGYFMREDS